MITFQQVSGDSGIYETFQPYLTNLRNYAKSFATNTRVEFGWHMTWAYANESIHDSFTHYNRNQINMYHSILESAKQAVKEMGFKTIIPSGTAIQNARTNKYLQAIGDDLTRDGFHLDLGIGRFIAGLTLFEALLAKKYNKDLFKDISFHPFDDDELEPLSKRSKQAVKKAVEAPFNIADLNVITK